MNGCVLLSLSAVFNPNCFLLHPLPPYLLRYHFLLVFLLSAQILQPSNPCVLMLSTSSCFPVPHPQILNVGVFNAWSCASCLSTSSDEFPHSPNLGHPCFLPIPEVLFIASSQFPALTLYLQGQSHSPLRVSTSPPDIFLLQCFPSAR